MKKLLSVFILVLCLALCGPFACSQSAENDPDPSTPVKFTVAFEVDGERYATKKVNAGETITGTVENPSKAGFDFDYWMLDGTEVDIYTYVVNSNITFVAHFTEKTGGGDTTNYFSVYIQVNGTYLTQEEAETFEARFVATLSEEEIALTRFHIENGDAATFKAIVEGATDVDVVIGGNNPVNNFTAHADGEITNVAAGHFASTNRKVIIYATTDSLELATKLYAFATTEYNGNEEINLTVTVHGDTDVITVLTDKMTVINLPEVTVADGKEFKGWATRAGGEVALYVAIDAELKYDDVKSLVEENATELDLYPVIKDKPTENPGCSVYIQVQGTNLTQTEAETLRDRFLATLTEEERARVIFNIESVSSGTEFTTIINNADDVDVVIGGNNPLNTYPAHEDGPLANAGTGHFANTSRKIIIHENANDLDIATKLYTFVTSDYTE